VLSFLRQDTEPFSELVVILNLTPVPRKGYRIRLPKGTREQFEVALASYHEPVYAAPRPARTHRVRRGETVDSIAKQHGVTPAALVEVNGLRSNCSLKAGQQLRIPAKPARSRVVASLSPRRRTQFD